MLQRFRQIILNEKFIFSVILLNAVAVYLQVSGYELLWINVIDTICTIVFLLEMIVKLRVLGLRDYWHDGWNKMDGTLVILSIPSLIATFLPDFTSSLSMLLILRLLRVMKFFRLMHFFPNFSQILKGLHLAIRETGAIFACYGVIIFIVGLINCSLFSNIVPEYFSSPLTSIYTIFRLFSVEGWYEIPDAIASVSSPLVAHLVRFYFCALVIGGGIVGMSFINSIFVDAMAEDNNDDVKEQLARMEKKLDEYIASQHDKSSK